MDPRIQLTRPTVKAMQERLHQAYERGDIRLVRRISVLLEHGLHQLPFSTVNECWDVSISCLRVVERIARTRCCEFGLSPWRWSSGEVDPQPEKTVVCVD